MQFVKKAYGTVRTQLQNRLVLVLIVALLCFTGYIIILRNQLKAPVATEEYKTLTRVLDNEQEGRKKDQQIMDRMLSQHDRFIEIQERKDSILLNLVASDKTEIKNILKQRDEKINTVLHFNSNDITKYMSENFGE